GRCPASGTLRFRRDRWRLAHHPFRHPRRRPSWRRSLGGGRRLGRRWASRRPRTEQFSRTRVRQVAKALGLHFVTAYTQKNTRLPSRFVAALPSLSNKRRAMPVRWFALLAFLVTSSAQAGDWPQFRGPDRTGVSSETGLLPAWPKEGPKLLFTYREAGLGF